MSRYTKLQKLLEEKPDIDTSSLYSKFMLDCRSLLFEWVDAQDWFAVSKLPPDVAAIQSEELLDQALALLQQKKTKGLEIYIRGVVRELRQAYKNYPEQFVLDMASGLQEEDKLTSKMMEQPLTVPEGGTYLPVEDLEQRITTCEKHIENLQEISKEWMSNIKSQGQIDYAAKLQEVISQICSQIGVVLQGLTWHVNLWKTHQLHRCVKRQPADGPEKTDYVETLCEKVCALCSLLLEMVCLKSANSSKMNTTPTTSASAIPKPSNTSKALQEILRKLVELCFVVIEQPADLTLMVEKEKKEKDDSNSSKRFDTTVGLLGGKGLEKHVTITNLDIRLAFSRNLAQVQDFHQCASYFKIHSEGDQHRRGSRNADPAYVPYQIKCEKLRVERFTRTTNKGVYKQLYHVVYLAKVIFRHDEWDFEVPAQVISLPIIVRTGAIQGPEHTGALLWHSFSSKNVYDLNAEMATSMSIDSVIQMINERILSIGCRGLQPYERQFLQNRLTFILLLSDRNIISASDVSQATNGRSDGKKQPEISLDNFVKDKVKLTNHDSTGATANESRPFSLWLWLYSIFNLLQESLKEPCVDGVICGFASREYCIQVLENSLVSNGTFLLRFSESYRPGNHMNCKGAIAIVLKSEGKARFAPPIATEMIESLGLAHMIKQSGRVCKNVLGTSYNINTLQQRYPPKCPEADCTQFERRRYSKWDSPDNSELASVGAKRSADELKRSSMGSACPSAKQSCSSIGSPDPESSDSTADVRDMFQTVGIQYRSKQQNSSSMGSPQSPGSAFGSPGQIVSSPQPSIIGVNIPSTVLDEMSPSACFQGLDGEVIDHVTLMESNPDLKPGQKMQLVHISESDISSVIGSYEMAGPGDSTPSNFLLGLGNVAVSSPEGQPALPVMNMVETLNLNESMSEHS